MDFNSKYLKYKNKYLQLKNVQLGGIKEYTKKIGNNTFELIINYMDNKTNIYYISENNKIYLLTGYNYIKDGDKNIYWLNNKENNIEIILKTNKYGFILSNLVMIGNETKGIKDGSVIYKLKNE